MNEVELHLGDCLEILPTLADNRVDAVITDPPYPDRTRDGYKMTNINYLENYQCIQLIFWSAIADFPLNFSAIHIMEVVNSLT